MDSNPTRNNFLRFLKQNNKRKKLLKNRKISEKYRKFSGKIGNFREKSDKRNFYAFFFSRLTEKRYFGEISAEKTEIFVHGSNPSREIPLLGIAHPVVGIYFSGTEDALGNMTHSGPRSEEMAKLALSCIFVKFWARDPFLYKL